MKAHIYAAVLVMASTSTCYAQGNRRSECSDQGYKARVANIDEYLKLGRQQLALSERDSRLIWNGQTYKKPRRWCAIQGRQYENRLKRLQMLQDYPGCVSDGEMERTQRDVEREQKRAAEDC